MNSAEKTEQRYSAKREQVFDNRGATVEEAAEFWGVSPKTVRRWIREGKVKAKKVHATSRRYFIPLKVLESYTPAYREASDF